MRTKILLAVALAASTIFSQPLMAAPAAATVVKETGMIPAVLNGDFDNSARVDLDKAFLTSLSFGPGSTLAVALADTPISQITKLLHAKLHKATDENGLAESWICEDAGQTRTTFYSTEDDRSAGMIEMVSEELATTPTSVSGCVATLTPVTPVAVGVPGLGATLADLTAAFGPTAVPNADGQLTIGFHGNTKEYIEADNVFYTVKNGQVVGVVFARWELIEGNL